MPILQWVTYPAGRAWAKMCRCHGNHAPEESQTSQTGTSYSVWAVVSPTWLMAVSPQTGCACAATETKEKYNVLTHWPLGNVRVIVSPQTGCACAATETKEKYNVLTHWPLGNVRVIDKNIIFKRAIQDSNMTTQYEIAIMWMPQNLTTEKSTLGQGMAWCHQAITSVNSDH